MVRRTRFHARWSALLLVPLYLTIELPLAAEEEPAHVVRGRTFALHISAEREAPPELAAQIAADLEALFALSPPFSNLGANVPWLDSAPTISVGRTGGVTWEQTIHAVTETWPYLEPLRSAEERRRHPRSSERFRVPQRLHPERIAEEVAAHPMVGGAVMSRVFRFGTYLDYDHAERLYTAWYGWGDCPSGCIFRRAYQFHIADEEVELIDAWGTLPNPYRLYVPSRIRLAAGGAITLAGSDLPTMELQWHHDDTLIGDPGPELTIDPITEAAEGTYTLRGVDLLTGETVEGDTIEFVVKGPDFAWGRVPELRQHSNEVGVGGWIGDHPVFGLFRAAYHPWIELYRHGWWFEIVAGDGSRLFHDSQLGWIWTADDLYPYLFDYSGSRWLYYSEERSTTQSRWFYDFAREMWANLSRSSGP